MNDQHDAAPWWYTGVIYQIWPRSFYDASGDGIGDLEGVIAKLDYLAWLGVDALWLSPIHPSPLDDSGYDVSNYLGIHPQLGDLDTFDRLIDAAKQRGIRVLLDLVPNHTSERHPWFLESRKDRDNDRRDWYVWRDPAPDGGPPNNWLAYFGGPTWTFDEATGQYYLHTFYPEQPDLNWRNPAVRGAIYEVIRFWLERGVAGFRVDGLENIAKDPLFRDEAPDPYTQHHELARFRLQKIYSVAHPDIHHMLREMREVFDAYPDRLFIGEMSYSASLRRTLSYYGHRDYGEVEMPLNFGLINVTTDPGWTPDELQCYINSFDALTPAGGGWPNYALSNHDKPRIATRFGAASRAAAVLLMTLRGTPFVYYGDEIGMTDVDIPSERHRDRFSSVPGHDRDAVRTPMRWQQGPNVGFCPPDETPYLPVGEVNEGDDVAAQRDDPQSLLSLYRQPIHYRREQPALTIGHYYPILNPPDGTMAYLRGLGQDRVLVTINFSDAPKTLRFSDPTEGSFVLSSCCDREGRVELQGLELRPYEAVVIEVAPGRFDMPRLVTPD
ncbi:MAG: alpha-amylase family glycosyl hydrolase [Trueperaceae bacterium]|nr:alpha-amylase family glycosyl hydrolase [Trueperaceae bacterium]